MSTHPLTAQRLCVSPYIRSPSSRRVHVSGILQESISTNYIERPNTLPGDLLLSSLRGYYPGTDQIGYWNPRKFIYVPSPVPRPPSRSTPPSSVSLLSPIGQRSPPSRLSLGLRSQGRTTRAITGSCTLPKLGIVCGGALFGEWHVFTRMGRDGAKH